MRISDRVRASSASDKVVLIASDMLENGSVSSFYSHNAIGYIVHQTEMKKAAAAGLVSEFGGVRLYEICALVNFRPSLARGGRSLRRSH